MTDYAELVKSARHEAMMTTQIRGVEETCRAFDLCNAIEALMKDRDELLNKYSELKFRMDGLEK